MAVTKEGTGHFYINDTQKLQSVFANLSVSLIPTAPCSTTHFIVNSLLIAFIILTSTLSTKKSKMYKFY
jgi:hypothetical protein